MKLNQIITTIFFMCITPIAFSAQLITQEKSIISITATQPTFTIKLKSNPTTGYLWSLTSYDHKLISLKKHYFQHGNPKLIGAPGFEFWTFKVNPSAFTAPHQTKIQFLYARSWEHPTNEAPVVFRLDIGVKK